MSSSWKLETSQTTSCPGSTTPTRPVSGLPTLPGDRGAEHVAEQLRRRRLAVRARDGEDRASGQQPEPELDLAPDRDAALARGLHERRLTRHAGALHEDVRPVEQRRIRVVAERPIGADDLHPARLEHRARRLAGARQAEHDGAPHSRNCR